MSDITEQHVRVDGLDYVLLGAGADNDGPLVLCLHGFPDCARGWSRLLPALAAAGYRAVAPFMRGYAPTAAPADGRCSVGAWACDVLELDEHLGGDGRTVVIGHDWGALTAAAAGAFAPDRVARLVTMSITPVSIMATWIGTEEGRRYFAYQDVLAAPDGEDRVSADDLAYIDELWATWSPGYTPDPDEIGAVKDALRDRAHLSAALGMYRSTRDPSLIAPEHLPAAMASLSPTTQPTLYLHGRDDGCVPSHLADGALDALPPGSRVAIVDDAGHFLQYEQPDTVNRLVLDFLTAS